MQYAAVISIFSGRGHSIDAYCKNQPNRSKLVLYKPVICFNISLLYFAWEDQRQKQHFVCHKIPIVLYQKI